MADAPPEPELRACLRANLLADETSLVRALIAETRLDDADRAAVSATAERIVIHVRRTAQPGLMDLFLTEYGLSTREGVALMCLAEALLRVPDAETIDALIADKIAPADWGAHLGRSASSLVNASTWALLLTGRVLADDDASVVATLRSVVRRLGEPVVRTAVGRAMREMGRQFVLGRTIDEAMAQAAKGQREGDRHSYDMLGEAARTVADAERYATAYADAIAALAPACTGDVRANPGISVKLSALHPRFEHGQRGRVMDELVPTLRDLARAAAAANMGFNVDAEEADRLDLSLDVIAAVLDDTALAGWDGFGVVVQAYAKRAPFLIDWLEGESRNRGRRLMVRLVKGAYWDSEIKRAQVQGLGGYPVFTRKAHSDVAFLACARKLLDMTDRIYPQFATHNAHSVAAVMHMAGERRDFELQRLHGMGEAVHAFAREHYDVACRVYAPVGAHEDLLAYLVRRLLENGANSSFVNQLVDEAVPPAHLARDPIAAATAGGLQPNPAISTPGDLFRPDRTNSLGFDLTDPLTLDELDRARAPFRHHQWSAAPRLAVEVAPGPQRTMVEPAAPERGVGTVREATAADVEAAVAAAMPWSEPVVTRRTVLERAAALYEANAAELFGLLAREAGKTLPDAVGELREAVDFLRYYAAEAERLEQAEPGTALGVVACISPWNFPLAIFTGQLAACLAAGNAVIAKPAEQTPLIADRTTRLLHDAGVPRTALQCLPGDGERVGAPLTGDPRIAGVVFTGSTATAQTIHRTMAAALDPTAPLIAETGGINAMIVDSTALPEQAVRDVLASAFQSAGQRCSALRVLYVQADVEDRTVRMLKGAMEQLTLGDPWNLATDVGPVIDAAAQDDIDAYVDGQRAAGRVLRQRPAPARGRFVGPALIRCDGIGDVSREVFGPVLHLATFRAADLERVIAEVNASGYGLTFGLHSRIDDRVQLAVEHAHVGNLYVNRNQIGAVVGSQPFGGEALSGTGPKAGGRFYVARLRRAASVVEATGEAASAEAVPPAAVQAALDLVATQPTEAETAVELLHAVATSPTQRAAATRAAALVAKTADLPGPTGESNRLWLHPRGTGLCVGNDLDPLLDHVAALVGVGGRAVVVAPGAEAGIAPWRERGLPVAGIDGLLAPADLTTLSGFAVVCAAEPTPTLRARRQALAARQGPILPLLVGPPDARWLVHERHLCIDTTASGGNASLLAASGS
ncbi:MAG: bifunctional proline dehydrogenase/L-glutamate gamma-semialdehyde dehydrogenase PutA [Pseudomonadota bacterium]